MMGRFVHLFTLCGFCLLFLRRETCAYNFEIGYEYHYEYKADSVVLADFQVLTIVKFSVLPLVRNNGSLLCQIHLDSFTQSAGGKTKSNPAGWNFEKGFEFELSEDGLIKDIGHHKEDHHEVINLKKVLASVFSAIGKPQSLSSQTFINWEYDHSGYLHHRYAIQNTALGYKVHKFHESDGQVYRKHAKTLHYTNNGVIEFIKADDKVILQNKNKHKKQEEKHSVPGEKEIEVESSGDVNDIESNTATEVRLVNKVKIHKVDKFLRLDIKSKVKDIIVAKKEKSEKVHLEDVKVQEVLKSKVACIQSNNDEVSRNRTDCFAELVQLVDRLYKEDYEKLATKELSQWCQHNDTMCVSRRNVFIDLLLMKGDNVTQDLIIQHFFLNKDVNETDLFRIFFHVANLRTPTLEFLKAVEELCLGPNNSNIGLMALTKIEKHACLALGTLIKTFRNNSLLSEKTDTLLDSLQRWLAPHNQTQYTEFRNKRRPRRSVDGFDRELHNYTYSKMVLIHALGNTGSSRDHLLTYMQPGEGDNSWRRAAILAMRHFKCVESSTALLNLAVNDGHSVVKLQALELFEKHPLSNRSIPEHKDVLLSRFYNYKTLMRVKRGILDVEFKDGIFFSLKLPGIQWTKELGNSALGAAFGIILNNELEVEIKPLSGHAMLNVYDDVFAKVMLGWLNVEQYLFRAHACYRGHAGYDINILKDFGINGIEDLALIFDRIVKTIVDPVVKVVQAFKTLIQVFDKGIEYIVNKIIEVVKNFPLILESIVQKAVDAVMKVIEYGGVPWIDQIKKIIIKARYFVEDIKEDITNFYSTIADAITVTLPYVGKKLFDSVASIISALKNFLSNPVQSVTVFGKSVLDIKLAIGMFLDVKNKVIETLSFLKGGTPFWIDYWEDFKEIIGDVQDLFRLIFEKENTQSTVNLEDELSTALTDGVKMTKEETNIFIEVIKDSFGELTNQLKESLSDLVSPFFKAFISVFNAIKAVKSGYTSIRDTFIKIKNIVQKIFGSKFHITFPNRRRREDSTCGVGVWPTNQQNRYQTLGVDVRISYHSDIRCPVSGEVFREDKRVRILPTDEDFIDFEIIIENILPTSNISTSGQFLIAGKDIIGKADQSPCEHNCIHVSVRKKSLTPMADSKYEYIDPSPFLDHLLPTPQWIWDCRDYTYINFISVVSADAGEEELEEENEEIPRSDSPQDPGSEFPPVEPNYRPPEFEVAVPSDPVAMTAWNNFKNGFKGLVANFKDIAKQLFDFSNNRTGPNLLDLVDVNKYTLGRINELLGENVATEMKTVFDKLQQLRSSISAQNLDGLSMSKLRSLLSASYSSDSGAKSNMISRILSRTEQDCPSFLNRLPKGPGNVCFVHRSCNEISCAVLLSFANKRVMTTFSIKMDNCLKELEITTQSTTTVIKFENAEEIDERVRLLALSTLMSADLVVSVSFLWSNPVVSLSAELCVSDYISCLSTIPVMLNYELEETDCSQDNAGIILPSMNDITVEDFIAELSDHHLLDREILKVLDTIREAMIDELINDPRTLLKIMGKEFKNKIDFCADVEIPFPVTDFVFVDSETFPTPVFIMVGPVPIFFEFGAAASVGLKIEVGLCILSFKARATLIPWAGAKAWGGVYVQFFLFKAGIRLTGYLLETRFPITAEITYNKFPLDVRGRLDITLVPLRLKLEAYCILEFKICVWKCFKITITIFRGTLWTYSTKPISGNIFTNINEEKDTSPPQFSPPGVTGPGSRRKRETTGNCLIKQITGRNHKDPAYELQVAADDDRSNLKLFYAIGTQQGGTNVLDFTEMGGFSVLVATDDLPNGIPLYWTAKAVNSQGSDARVYCMLQTYDNTLPDGRVDPSYKYSSHPNVLSGTINVFDDSLLQETHLQAVGFSSGMYGSEIVSWKNLTLGSTTHRVGIMNDLKHFSVPKDGRLTTQPFATHFTHTPHECATQCINAGTKCVSFDYAYLTESCELQHVVEGPNARLRVSGTYMNYERLGVGYNSFERYEDLPLEHGNVYFINARIGNVLGYVGYLHSFGTMVDFTSPMPGPLGTDFQETTSAHGCHASIAQRCVEVTWKENHRHIIDGQGASTVFNGHTPLVDKLFTKSNHYISVNFDGFHDDESGIYQYTWAVGQSVCSHDVVNFSDPHEFLHSAKHWTHNGYQKNLHLSDGKYFMTVQCLNNVVFGGSLVTTVCHRLPITVDTTPPYFDGVEQIYFDEHFDILAIYYKAGDNESQLASADFGLGKTKYDVLVRKYSYHPPMNGDDHPFIVIEELDLQEGIPAWPRLRVDNGVGLFKAGSGPEPILIDRSPPIAGNVLDGNVIHHDIMYQSSDKEMCAQWTGFYDPESGIDHFRWGIGTKPEVDNVMAFRNFSHNTRHACVDIVLQHNTKYYSTLIVFNAALNSKDSNSSSDGVLVDTTPPVPGYAVDGSNLNGNVLFSSETATKSVSWDNFTDPESGIQHYVVSVYVNDVKAKTFVPMENTLMTDHSVSMEHDDKVRFEVESFNKAGLSVAVSTDGFTIDHTPPNLVLIQDNMLGLKYQTDDSNLNLRWQFEDNESGIKEYRYSVFELMHGMKKRVWPKTAMYLSISPSLTSQPTEIDFIEQLVSGATYSVHVTAINQAQLSTAHESNGVTIDPTPPIMFKVHLGLLDEDEEIEDGFLQHANSQSMRVSWIGEDPESDIGNFFVAIGTSKGDVSVTDGYIDMGKDTSADIKVELQTFFESGIIYYVAVKAENGAGILSNPMFSKPIKILKENIPGVIYDGREHYVDEDITNDKFSIAMHFQGFESEACNIMKYEWAIGSQPYLSDINDYTEYGLVHNETHGKAQTHVQLGENKTYHVTVRAKTGHNCHEEYIVSTSDGITTDFSPPKISDILPQNNEGHFFDFDSQSFYQTYTDSFEYKWNVSDISTLRYLNFSIGTQPLTSDLVSVTPSTESKIEPGLFSPTAGESYFVTVFAMDEVEYATTGASLPIIADISPPTIQKFRCTEVISTKHSVVSCSWISIEEESKLKQITTSIGSRELSDDIIKNTTLPSNINTWTVDVKNSSKLEYISKIYATLTVTNVLNQSLTETFQIEIDSSAPLIENVAFVTWTNPNKERFKQICQQPWTYVDVNISVLDDKESHIERAEICLGSKPGLDDIKDYQDLRGTYITIDNIAVSAGTKIFATVRACNKVGLHNIVTSDPITVSPDPVIEVLDGKGEKDVDYQSDLHVIQGSYRYSDNCPITRAEWSVEDLTGKTIQNFTIIPGNGFLFYNDELNLMNNVHYFVKIKLTDALNRTKTGVSDGITVRIQPPYYGSVRDGLDDIDIDYQESTTVLSANWDAFGDELSDDPTQQIDHYEISIGEDTKDHTTRTNIHYFTNVGLNKSYTFTGLNLTSKIVLYFVTVRGYSITGAYEENYSNGVLVGYRLGIIPGAIETNVVQSSESEISVSWTDFQSDIGINEYSVAVSSKFVTLSNKTFSCSDILEVSSLFDIVNLTRVGLNTYVTFTNLTLNHGMLYYITVIASDEIGQCSSSQSNPLLVDTTPPADVNVTFMINNWNVSGLKQFYVTESNEIEIQLLDLEDPESGIDIITFRLHEYLDCPTSEKQRTIVLKEIEALTDPKVRMKSLELHSNQYYYIEVTASNNAGLKTHLRSPIMLLDTGSPFVGTSKIGIKWDHDQLYQSSTSTIEALTAIARTEDAYLCDNTVTLFPCKDESVWETLVGDFSPENVLKYINKYVLKIGYNVPLTKVLKSGISRKIGALYEGKISISLSAAKGKNITTSVIMSASKENPYFPEIFVRPYQRSLDDVTFNISKTELINETISNNLNGTNVPTTTKSLTPPILVVNNQTGPTYENVDTEISHGFGFQVLGDQHNGSRYWDCLFWAKDTYGEIHKWTNIKRNPFESQLVYNIKITKREQDKRAVLDLQFLIDGEEKANIYGLSVDDKEMNIFVQTWNLNNYQEPLIDPIHPYRSQATLSKMKIPSNKTMDCIHGTGFYDRESGIAEIWAGVSDNVDEPGNVKKMELYKRMCTPCMFNCNFSCDTNCAFKDNKLQEFEIIPIKLHNLTLSPTILSNDGLNASVHTEIRNITQYRVNLKMVNFAGQSVISTTNPIIIDTTPPVCEFVECVDPVLTGMESPTQTLGSNKTIGAYWSCDDNISGIKSVYIKVGTANKDRGNKEDENKYKQKYIGSVSNVRVDLEDNIYFDDRTTYFVNLLVYNGAGLSAMYSCNVTTILSPPNVSAIDSQIIHSSGFDTDTGVGFVDTLDQFGITWNNKNNDTEYYKWQMGTYKGSADVIPPTIIGLTKEGSAQVIGGELWLNGNKTGKSLAALSPSTWRNFTEQEISNTESDFRFLLEPGRCVYLSLIAVGYSNLEANISTQQLCFKRKDKDLVIHNQQKNITIIGWSSNDKFEEVQHVIGNEHVVLQITGQVIGATVGVLSDADLNNEYGSASSFDYRTYLTNPNTTSWPTTREIRNRIIMPIGINFFVAPTPEMAVEKINVHIKYNPLVYLNNTVPALLLWDIYAFNSETKSYGIWRHVEENCGEDITKPRLDGNIYKTQICLHIFQNQSRKKRSTAVNVIHPYQFTLTAMNVSYYNSPPVIDIDTIVTKEDTPIINFLIPYHDDDLDSVQFYLTENPSFGDANITLNGSLTYYPKTNFFGNDSIKIKLQDDASYPAVVETTMRITVTGLNDMPLFGFLYNNSAYNVMVNKSLELTFEGNTTSHYLFDFGFADVDDNETLSFLSSVTNPNNVNFSVIRSDASLFIPDLFGDFDIRTHQEYSAEMTINKNFHGDFFYYILGYDSQKVYTERLETHIYILWSPCVNGICSPKFNDSPPCEDVSRAASFDSYKCNCYPGYDGEWCEREINECLQQPCGSLYNCINEINDYSCVIKPEALACLILSGLFVIIIIGIIYIRYRNNKKNSREELQDEFEENNFGEFDNELFSDDDILPTKTVPPCDTHFCSRLAESETIPFYQENPGPSHNGGFETSEAPNGTTMNDQNVTAIKWPQSKSKSPMQKVGFFYPDFYNNDAFSASDDYFDDEPKNIDSSVITSGDGSSTPSSGLKKSLPLQNTATVHNTFYRPFFHENPRPVFKDPIPKPHFIRPLDGRRHSTSEQTTTAKSGKTSKKRRPKETNEEFFEHPYPDLPDKFNFADEMKTYNSHILRVASPDEKNRRRSNSVDSINRTVTTTPIGVVDNNMFSEC